MSLPSGDQLRSAWDEANREQTFWHEHRDRYFELYPDQFVAVKNGKVVAVSPDLPRLVALLNSQGLTPADVWVRFIAASPRQLVL